MWGRYRFCIVTFGSWKAPSAPLMRRRCQARARHPSEPLFRATLSSLTGAPLESLNSNTGTGASLVHWHIIIPRSTSHRAITVQHIHPPEKRHDRAETNIASTPPNPRHLCAQPSLESASLIRTDRVMSASLSQAPKLKLNGLLARSRGGTAQYDSLRGNIEIKPHRI